MALETYEACISHCQVGELVATPPVRGQNVEHRGGDCEAARAQEHGGQPRPEPLLWIGQMDHDWQDLGQKLAWMGILETSEPRCPPPTTPTHRGEGSPRVAWRPKFEMSPKLSVRTPATQWPY